MVKQLSPKELKTGVRWLVWSGVLTLLTVLGWGVYGMMLKGSITPVAVRLHTVKLGTIETTINESGTVELRGQQTLKSPTEGAVDQVLVRPGDQVTAGQTVITLRYPERQTALATQELAIQKQKLLLERNRQKIAEVQEQLRVNEQEYEKLQALAKVGAISQQQLKNQGDQVRTDRTTLRDAQADAHTAEVELQLLQLERQRTQREIKDTLVTAPIHGKVLDVRVKDGDGVQFRTDLLTLGDPSQELVKLQLSTLNAAQVRVNQLARISVIGPDAPTYTGRVQSLYPQAILPGEPEQGSNNQSEQATVPATVRLDQPTGTLIPGSQVNVEIVLEQRRNVVTLPTEVIQNVSSNPFVWVPDNQGKTQKRPITLGLEGTLNIEVTSGLRPKEKVIQPPAESPLEIGTPIREN